MHPVLIVLSVFITCILIIAIVTTLKNRQFSGELEQVKKETEEATAAIAAKKAFIKSELGFDLYSYTTIAKAFNKVTETYNTNVNSFVLYNHINSLQIPGGNLTEEALPVETIYSLLKSITRRQELMFQYR